MRGLRKVKIMAKVTLGFAGLVLVFGAVMLLINAQSVAREKANTVATFEERAVSIGRTIDATVSADWQLNSIGPSLVKKITGDGSGIRELNIVLKAPSGMSTNGYWTVASTDGTLVGKPAYATDLAALKQNKYASVFGTLNGSKTFDVSYPLHNQAGDAFATVAMKFDTSAMDKLIVPSSTYVYIIIMMLLGLTLGVVMAYSITKPIKQLTDATNKIASGDLNVTIPEFESRDEIHDLKEGIKGVLAAVQFLTDEVEKKEATGRA